jgi:hypothetical protein
MQFLYKNFTCIYAFIRYNHLLQKPITTNCKTYTHKMKKNIESEDINDV